MSKRIDKKRMKQAAAIQTAQTILAAQNVQAQNVQAQAAPEVVPAPASAVSFYIQYQNAEYLESEIVAKVTEKCKAEGASDADLAELSIYLKPEDHKAYYAYNGKNGSVEL